MPVALLQHYSGETTAIDYVFPSDEPYPIYRPPGQDDPEDHLGTYVVFFCRKSDDATQIYEIDATEELCDEDLSEAEFIDKLKETCESLTPVSLHHDDDHAIAMLDGDNRPYMLTAVHQVIMQSN